MASKNWLVAAAGGPARRCRPTLPLRRPGPNAAADTRRTRTSGDAVDQRAARTRHQRGPDHSRRPARSPRRSTRSRRKPQSMRSTGASPSLRWTCSRAVVAIQPGTGEVRAWYGGRFYGKAPNGTFTDYVDNVTDPIQPGSSFKPIALAAALAKGISLNSYYNGNEPSGDHSRAIRRACRTTAARASGRSTCCRPPRSRSTAFLSRWRVDAGTQNVIDMAHELGIPDSEKLPAVDVAAAGCRRDQPAQHDRRLRDLRRPGRAGAGPSGRPR